MTHDNKEQANNFNQDFNSLGRKNSSEIVLPRQGWQDKQAFVKAIIKVKRALDIAEISHFLD